MIWIARHGETTWNRAGRYQGRLESDLTPLGEQQAEALADRFGRDDSAGDDGQPRRILSSPMRRCTETAAPVAARLGLPVELDARLIEIAHGSWDGRFKNDVMREDPARYRAWREDPAHVAFAGGETLGDVLARWQSFAGELVHAPRPTLVITHDAVLRCALLDALGLALEAFWQMHAENGGYATLAVSAGRLVVVAECVTAHLGGARAPLEKQAL